jgi:predicted alpha/beta-fold hydrolase
VWAVQAILAECPSLTQPYKVAPWLTNPHVETIFAALFRRTPAVKYERELLRMEDGGTVAVDWLDGDVVQVLSRLTKLHCFRRPFRKSTQNNFVHRSEAHTWLAYI